MSSCVVLTIVVVVVSAGVVVVVVVVVGRGEIKKANVVMGWRAHNIISTNVLTEVFILYGYDGLFFPPLAVSQCQVCINVDCATAARSQQTDEAQRKIIIIICA